MRLHLLVALAGVAAMPLSRLPEPARPAHFWELPGLDGGYELTFAYGVSDKGDAIAGESFSEDGQIHGEGLRWDRWGYGSWVGSRTDYPEGGIDSAGAAISGKGGWMVGRANLGGDAPTTEAYRWNERDGFELLPRPRDYVIAAAVAADDDATHIVGYGGPNQGYAGIHALRWTKSRWMWTATILDDTVSWATDVTSDGSLVSGRGNSESAEAAFGESGREAALWAATGGGVVRHWLGALDSGDHFSEALSLVDDGTTVTLVGYSGSWPATRAVLWEVATADAGDADAAVTMVELPLPDGEEGAGLGSIDDDATRIVGNAWHTDEGGNLVFDVYLWERSADGDWVPSSLSERLAGYGISAVEGWTLVQAGRMSADGTVLCGVGVDPDFNYSAWAAEIP